MRGFVTLDMRLTPFVIRSIYVDRTPSMADGGQPAPVSLDMELNLLSFKFIPRISNADYSSFERCLHELIFQRNGRT